MKPFQVCESVKEATAHQKHTCRHFQVYSKRPVTLSTLEQHLRFQQSSGCDEKQNETKNVAVERGRAKNEEEKNRPKRPIATKAVKWGGSGPFVRFFPDSMSIKSIEKKTSFDGAPFCIVVPEKKFPGSSLVERNVVC
ncbi:hypothetical protein RUM44_011093 [Polyplax serrata]|uniref:Uncharacterized protein n=1 Tax=Polyplax serrata TaxID=468196 RepID=A0ABR1AP31_POLSC